MTLTLDELQALFSTPSIDPDQAASHELYLQYAEHGCIALAADWLTSKMASPSFDFPRKVLQLGGTGALTSQLGWKFTNLSCYLATTAEPSVCLPFGTRLEQIPLAKFDAVLLCRGHAELGSQVLATAKTFLKPGGLLFCPDDAEQPVTSFEIDSKRLVSIHVLGQRYLALFGKSGLEQTINYSIKET